MILKDGFGAEGGARRNRNFLLLLMSLIATHGNADLEYPKDKHYTWKTGQWSRCMGESCGPGGVQTRMVWCVHTEGWTTHHSSCHHDDKPESQRQCFRVCDWHQELFEWEVSEWGPCVLVGAGPGPGAGPVECVTAQHGVQRRSVHCLHRSNRTSVTPHICQHFSPRPSGEQACLAPCPHACVVSAFSAWSSCSRSCGAGLQHRARAVLAPPLYGGAACPELAQARPCPSPAPCPPGEERQRYSLRVGPWSACRLAPPREAWLGGRTTLDLSADAMRRNVVKRHVQAAQRRPRHRQHPHLHPNAPHIQIGYQTRQVRCTRTDGKNAMLSLCIQDDAPMTFQSCVMPMDCEVSDWSVWSPCSKTCQAADLSPGYRVRTRGLTQLPIGGGQECPALEEKEACNIVGDLLPKCPRFVWRSTDWGECQVAPLLNQQYRRHNNLSALCGGGIQTREIYCTQLPDDSGRQVARPVSARLCVGDLPSAVQPCHIPCPEPCLLSDWSAWGPCLHGDCAEPQGRRGFRMRRREVLREAAGGAEDCPHLAESIPCEVPACFLWDVRAEGPCLPSDGICGPGGQEQRAICTDTQGEVVDSELCLATPAPPRVPCLLPCPRDCVVGSWTSWSSCSHSCSTKAAEGRQSRTRAILAHPGEGGRACPAAPALEEWRGCNSHPCSSFHWDVSNWGPCLQAPPTATPTAPPACPVGVQSRSVSCVKTGAGQVVPKRCPESSRPDAVRPCLLPCKRDCAVTPFSEWTLCPDTCQPVNSTPATQSRYRIIIQRSAKGGQECPDTLYEERDCESLPVCPTHRWQTHRWSECVLVPGSVRQGAAGPVELCGRGLETRSVACVAEDDAAAHVSQCQQWAGPMPVQVRQCQVACRDDCTLTGWSPFSQCAGCGSWRSRKRALTGRSKKRERCQRAELYPLVETEPCPCEELVSRPYGSWSDCVLPEPGPQGALQGWRARRDRRECGPGRRYRALACLDPGGRLVDPSLCTSTGYVEEVCHVPCPLDCRLSDWSSWSPCSAPCGGGLKVRSKWLREKPFNGGRPCPKLDLKNQVSEAVVCRSACGQFGWTAEPWSVCAINALDLLPACGEGVQSRKVRCVRVSGEVQDDSASDSLDDSLCDPDEMPPRAQTCFLPCPGQCVMSPWGPWSACPLPCDPINARRRRRWILRPPGTGHSCPEDLQKEPCLLNSTCFTYQYRLSDWSSCRLSDSAVCGRGSRTRLLDCVRSDGKITELGVCEELGLQKERALAASCEVACPVSCLLSEWSPWTECSHTCGSQGHMMRVRRVLQPAQEEGRPCPPQLSQMKPCPVRPCYRWLLGAWSSCRVEGAECGEGVRERNLTCVVEQGGPGDLSPPRPVEEEKCDADLRRVSGQDLRLPCSVPCPGDCHLTDWSSWSSCQLTCLEGRSFETTGRQARSRAVVVQVMENQDSCPLQVFQTRPCKGGKCHSYEWKSSSWRDNQRSVWCQRSDGVNVTGGCFLLSRPVTIRHCYPSCTKPFSYCTQSGVCGCERGYTEVMTSHGFLDYCTKTPGSDNKKADVKTSSGRLKPGTSQIHTFFREWSLQPVGPDGRVKLWVYAVTALAFLLIVLIITLSFMLWKSPKQNTSSTPPQKPLTLAYDGDVDM